MSRRLKLTLLTTGVLAFLLISFGLARVLSAASAERGVIDVIVHAEARGDAPGIVRGVEGCAARPACTARARLNAAALRRPGEPKLLRLDPSSRFLLGGFRGITRVAWIVPGHSKPVVQCFSVHHAGNVVSGFTVTVTDVSKRIRSTGLCKGQKEGI